ncbi:MAG TPA: hypothetical protein ENN77_02090 [Candidatus Wirthbacteria bacterium]|nr:hypothetical protein [Candidatus Wirthbacteria bacterium]
MLISKQPNLVAKIFLGILCLGIITACTARNPQNETDDIPQGESTTQTTEPKQTPDQQPTQPVAKDTLEHYGISVEPPTDWLYYKEPISALNGSEIDHDLYFSSPDYLLASAESGYEGIDYLKQGALIIISARPTLSANIREVYDNDEILRLFAQNSRFFEINTFEAIQYDYSFENTNQIVSSFIMDEKLFSIVYKYALGTDPNSYIDTYEALLASVH